MAVGLSAIRTLAVGGQGRAGKTSVADAMVFAAGGNNRLGRVDEGNSVFDTEPEEIKHRCSVSTSLFHVKWDKHDVTILDTPGQGNFVQELRPVLRGVAGVVMVLDAASQPRAEATKVRSWTQAEELPTLGFINRLDRSDQDFAAILEQARGIFGPHAVVLQLPIVSDGRLVGVVDLLGEKALVFEGVSGKFKVAEIPGEMAESVAEYRNALMEEAAEGSDELLEKYLDNGELGAEDIVDGLKAAVLNGLTVPLLCGSAVENVGFPQLLDAVVEFLPSPEQVAPEQATDEAGETVEVAPDKDAPFVAFVFKTIVDPHAGKLSLFKVVSGQARGELQVVNTRTLSKERIGHLFRLEGRKTVEIESASAGDIVGVAKLKDTHSGDTLADPKRKVVIRSLEPAHPAISFALETEKRGEEDKAMQGLLRVAEEDQSLQVERDEDSGEILLSGSGQLHVEVACEKLERKYGVKVVLKAPKVPYKETIRKAVKAHGRLKKQTGGHGQFADCRIEVEPQPSGAGFEFVNKVVGGSIPRGFIPAVQKGVVEAMKNGVIAGYPVVDVKVTLYDGQYHDVDSSEMAFKTAGSMAFKNAMAEARAVLLEPYVTLEVSVPDECMGDVMGDLNSRRAKVEGMEQIADKEVIRAKAPLAELLRYQPDLTSLTSGRGSFEMGFSHYERLPDHLTAGVVESVNKEKAS